MENTVILSAVRTPTGCFQGSLASLSATDLGAIVISQSLQKIDIPIDSIDEIMMGCVLSAGLKQAPARQAMLKAGLPLHIGATTINKVCGSGMKAVMHASDAIRLGNAKIIIAGGMESMSNAPYLMPKARSGYRMGHNHIIDHMFYDGLEDAASGRSMGLLAQDMADKKGYTRTQMDEFSINSLNRAKKAIEYGFFKDETIPIFVKTRKGDIVVSTDEYPAKVDISKILSLKPAFGQDGTITAATSSSISDGASALVISSESIAIQHNLMPLALIKGYASHAQKPEEFSIAPIGAIEKVLKQTGWNAADVDAWEINEAFAMVPMAAMDAFDLDHNKVNIHGGACAFGHPLGSSGSRIIVTLVHTLKRLNKKKGIAAVCIGGGEATAIAIEVS